MSERARRWKRTGSAARASIGLAVVGILAAAGCNAVSTEGTASLPTHGGASGQSDDALITGEVRIDLEDGDACVWLLDGDFRWEVVWPRGFRVRHDGEPAVLDASGNVVVTGGERLVAAGGYRPAGATGCLEGAAEAVRIDRIMEAGS